MFDRKRLALLMVLAMLLAVVPSMAQDKPAEIGVWIAFGGSRLDWTTQKAEIFNKIFPQYHVTVEGGKDYEKLADQITLASEQGTLPAVVHYNEVNTVTARNSGSFKSIADALGDRTEVNGIKADLDDIVQPLKAYYTLDGKFSSMPWNASSAIWFSNMDMLKKAGVDKPPATWAEVDAACAKVMAMADHPKYCFTWPNYGWFFEQWLAQQNATLANNDNGRGGEAATELTFNSDAGVAIVKWLKEEYDKGYLYYSGKRDGDSWDTVDAAFLPGDQLAMAAYSSSDTASYTSTGKTNGFEVVASRLPYNQDAEGGWTGNLIGGGSLWLVDGLTPEQEEGALTFILWLTDTANSAEWHQVTGYFPVRTSSVDLLKTDKWYDAIEPQASQVWKDNAGVQDAKGKVWFDVNPNFIVAAQQVADSKVTPATSGAVMGAFNPIRSIVTAALDKALLTKDADPKAILDQAVQDANKALSDYNATQGS
jgi:sn-glycerol 3-phosphate transport system substrate-binding protein